MEGNISIQDVWKIYDIGGQKIEALKSVNMEIEAGSFVSIVGHSGSGKTTLLSTTGGLTEPSKGKVYIAGVNIWALNDKGLSGIRNKRMGFIFQFASLIPTLRAIDNIVLPVIFSQNGPRLDKKKIYERAEEMLSLLGLETKLNSYPQELSGGQQRRVAIARAFINRPAIVLADEPTGDLDAVSESEVMGFFHRINREEGITFVMVTHNLYLASLTSRTYTMKDGILAG
jgi:ABC-type lipoprotein export system ATPase subunit